MANTEQHPMQLELTHPSGAQEWACTICSRRFVLQAAPTFNMIDLESGDGHVSHIGATGELQIGLSQVQEVEEQILSDELRDALNEVLKDIDFED